MSTYNAKGIFTLDCIHRFPFISILLPLTAAFWMLGHQMLAMLPLHSGFLVKDSRIWAIKWLSCKKRGWKTLKNCQLGCKTKVLVQWLGKYSRNYSLWHWGGNPASFSLSPCGGGCIWYSLGGGYSSGIRRAQITVVRHCGLLVQAGGCDSRHPDLHSRVCHADSQSG